MQKNVQYSLFALMILLSITAKGERFQFKTVGSLQGLSQSSAMSIWQDGLGRMWFGNDALNCYNGTTTKIYRISEFYPDIEDADIHGICGTDSTMFFLAGSNILSFDFTTETLKNLEIEAQFLTIIDDILYYSSSSDGILYSYNEKSGESKLLYKMNKEDAVVTYILQDTKDIFWLGTTRGLYKVDIKTDIVISHAFETDVINSLFKDSYGNLWVSCRKNKVQIITPGGTLSPLPANKNTSKIGEVLCFTEDSKGVIWIGSYNGIYTVQPPVRNKNAVAHNEPMMTEASIFALYTDKQGTIWVGSYYGDVHYFNPETDNYTLYIGKETEPGFLHGIVLGDMTEDNDGNIYVASEGSGVNVINHNSSKISHITSANGLPNNKIRTLFFDKEYNRLYISSYLEGLSYLDVKTNKLSRINTNAFTSRYHMITEKIIPFENYLILSTQDGLFRINRNTLDVTPLFGDEELQNLCSGVIRTLYLDDKNILWISSFEKGLFTVDMNTRKALNFYGDGPKDKSTIPSAVISICGSSKHGLYFATLKSGILSYNDETKEFNNYTTKDNLLLSNICYNVALSRYGNLVATSNKGISILNISARKSINGSSHIRLDGSSPMMSISPDCGLYVSPKDGLIYVGGLQRLISFDEKDITTAKRNYSLYFSSLLVNNTLIEPPSDILPQSLSRTKEIVLPANQNTISLTFASSNYISSYYTGYEYKLNGLDGLEEWIKTDLKTITYTALPAGKYKLEVRETTDPEKIVSIGITIQPVFWRSIPAYFMYFLVLVIIIMLILKDKNTKLQLRNALSKEMGINSGLEESSKNKIRFFSGIVNEFRTPLTLIITMLDGFINDYDSISKAKMEKVKKQTMRLQSLFMELQEFNKAEDGMLHLKVGYYSLTDLIKDIYETVSDYEDVLQISFHYYHSEEDVKAWFDKEQLQKVLYNIIFMASKLVKVHGQMNIYLNSMSNKIDIQISNIGEVYDEEMLAQISDLLNDKNNFGENYERKHALYGNSIGLILSKKIMDMHKGALTLKADKSETSFIISLKTGEKHFSEEEKIDSNEMQAMVKSPSLLEFHKAEKHYKNDFNDDVAEEAGAGSDKRFKLLVVDKDDEIRVMLKDVFSSVYEVHEATNVDEAIKIAIAEQPDIIISEIALLGQSGIELCNMLKSNIETLHIPIILMTTYPSSKQQNECVRVGVDDYIVKPFNLEYLFLRCNSIVKSRNNMLGKFKGKKDHEMQEMATNTQDQRFLDRAIRILENNLENADFDTYIWSKELGIGRTRLFDRIKQVTGMTPNDYIMNVKISRAMAILREKEELTVSEVAYQFGFSNPAYFTKCFKRQVGITPQQYRKKG